MADMQSMPARQPNYERLSNEQKHQITLLMVETAMRISDQFDSFAAYTEREASEIER